MREGANVAPSRFRTLVREYDHVVDATGQPAVSLRARGATDRYTGDVVALNADVTGDFSEYRRVPRIVFEGGVGYGWVFPESDGRANVGWAGDERPDDYMAALRAFCDRAGVPRPDCGATNVYTIPRGPSLAPPLARPEPTVSLVGDAAGIANRYRGEGICRALRSSRLLAACLADGRGDEYPGRLSDATKGEYRLATLMRGVWEETEEPALLAAVADAIDGLTVADATRHPRRVYARLAARPRLVSRLARVPGLRRRLLDGYRDRWEHDGVTHWAVHRGASRSGPPGHPATRAVGCAPVSLGRGTDPSYPSGVDCGAGDSAPPSTTPGSLPAIWSSTVPPAPSRSSSRSWSASAR